VGTAKHELALLWNIRYQFEVCFAGAILAEELPDRSLNSIQQCPLIDRLFTRNF